MPARPRPLTEADRAEWAQFARLITPLRGQPPVAPVALPPPAAELPPRPRLVRPPAGTARAERPRPVTVGAAPAGVDASTWQRLRSGKLIAVRKLDLHGMTAQHAYHALIAFLRNAHADRLRCVEVITGRGSGESGGTIRREFPIWLNLPEIRPLVLAAVHPHPANPGSVRLLLRRIR
ncbi:MAG: Smr/MutS family protein [Porticoccaceae bacterium]